MTPVPSTWTEAELSELGEWYGGTTPRKADPAFWLDGSIPWISPKDMKTDTIDTAEDKITLRAIDDGAARTLPPGTLLMVTRSGILQHSVPVAVTTVEVATNQDIKALVPAPGIVPHFIAAQLRWRALDLLAQTAKAGTTVDSIDFGRLKRFKILLAPSGEQHRIAERLFELRSRVARIRDELDQLPLLITQTRELVANALAAGQLTRDWQDDLGPTAPHAQTLRELVSRPVRTGLSIRGRGEPPGVRALRLSALRGPIVDLSDVRYLPLDETRAERFELYAGDVLISRGSGTKAHVGRASLVPAVSERTIFPDTAFRVRLDPMRILPEWFVAVWNAPITRMEFEKRVRTTAGIWKVALRDLLTVSITIPSLDEQREALTILRAASARLVRALSKQDRSLRLLGRFEQAIYSMAFSGRLVAQSADEGDAVTLLNEIRSRPVLAREQRPKRKAMPTNQDRFRDLLPGWPDEGLSFEQLRALLPAPYDELKDIIFGLLEQGSFGQRFDKARHSMVLVRKP